MLAQRQPSFKECVIAHRSSGSAPKMIGAQACHRNCGFVKTLAFLQVVEEHSVGIEGLT